MIDYEETLALAVKKHGALPQIGMLYEEMGELMTVINQWTRGRVQIERVAEEMADVCIMLQQLSYVVETLTQGELDAEGFDDLSQVFFDSKMERLAMRLVMGEVEVS